MKSVSIYLYVCRYARVFVPGVFPVSSTYFCAYMLCFLNFFLCIYKVLALFNSFLFNVKAYVYAYYSILATCIKFVCEALSHIGINKTIKFISFLISLSKNMQNHFVLRYLKIFSTQRRFHLSYFYFISAN